MLTKAMIAIETEMINEFENISSNLLTDYSFLFHLILITISVFRLKRNALNSYNFLYTIILRF